MVDYREEQLFPFPRDRVWQLLTSHLDDSIVTKIHPLIRSQKTVSKTGDQTLVERTIDARGKLLTSQWRITYRPPDYGKWEIVTSNGPYAVGSWIENTYSEATGGTLIRSHGELKITVVPFFIPQRSVLRSVLNTIDNEDQTFLGGRG